MDKAVIEWIKRQKQIERDGLQRIINLYGQDTDALEQFPGQIGEHITTCIKRTATKLGFSTAGSVGLLIKVQSI